MKTTEWKITLAMHKRTTFLGSLIMQRMQHIYQVVEKLDVEEVEDIADAPGFDGDRCESCK